MVDHLSLIEWCEAVSKFLRLLDRCWLECVYLVSPILLFGSLNVLVDLIFNAGYSHVALRNVQISLSLSTIVSPYWWPKECWISSIHRWSVLRRWASNAWNYYSWIVGAASRTLGRVLSDTFSSHAIFSFHPGMLWNRWLNLRLDPLLLSDLRVIDHNFLRLSSSRVFEYLARVPSHNPTGISLIGWCWSHHALEHSLSILRLYSLRISPGHELGLTIPWAVIVHIIILVIWWNLASFWN